MTAPKPIASLSLDLDNKWSYLKTHGDSNWDRFPSYLDTLTSRVLGVLAQRNLKITFFVVGQDAALEKNEAALRSIAADGHEIANHSFSHEPWLHLYSRERLQEEVASTEEHITRITGQRPVGFRGPGFTLSEATIEILAQRRYLYDASTLPTFIGPLARIYYFMTANLSGEELKQRSSLFGSIRDGLRPLKPYRWGGKNGLLEIPVTTMPLLRFPIHLTYVLYLSTFSPRFALAYFRMALIWCRAAGIGPSLLLHSLDFLGQDDGIGLEFFPTMNLRGEHKRTIITEVLRIYCEEFRVVSVREHALHHMEASETKVAQHYIPDPVRTPGKR